MSAAAAEQEQNYLQGGRAQKLLDLLDYSLAADSFLQLQIVKATQLGELQRSGYQTIWNTMAWNGVTTVHPHLTHNGQNSRNRELCSRLIIPLLSISVTTLFTG